MAAIPLEESPPGALRVWLLAARPATLAAGAVPVLVGTALAQAAGQLHTTAALVALVCSLLIQVGTNLFNDYADFGRGADTHTRLGPARATQRGWLRPRAVLAGAAWAFGLAALGGLYLLYLGGWPILAIGIMSIAAGIAYTGGPYPLAYHGLGEVFVLLCFGFMAVCGTYYVQTGGVSIQAAVAAAAVGLLASAILVVNNLRDRHTDQVAAKRTLAVRWGAPFARREYVAALGLAYALPPALVACRLGGWGWLLPWLSVPLAVRAVRDIYQRDGAALNPLLGQTARLELAFGVLLAVGVCL